jgi:hypothetical protein
VMHTGIAWEDLPQEYGYGSGVTCWRRLRDWQAAGVWDALHHRLLHKLNAVGAIDSSFAAVDGSQIRRAFGGLLTGPSPVTVPARAQASPPRRRDRIPLAIALTGSNRNDVTQLLPLVTI